MTALVGVEDDPGDRLLPAANRHLQRCHDQFDVLAGSGVPGHDSLGEDVDDERHMREPGGHHAEDAGDVDDRRPPGHGGCARVRSSTSTCCQVRPAMLSSASGSVEVHVDGVAEHLGVIAQDWSGRADAGVVDKTSRRPSSATAAAASSSQSSRTETSVRCPSTVVPAARSSAAKVRSRSLRRAARTRLAPTPARARAKPTPRPELAPVTTTILSRRKRSRGSLMRTPVQPTKGGVRLSSCRAMVRR